MSKRTMRCPHKDKVSDCPECWAILNPDTPQPSDTVDKILEEVLETVHPILSEYADLTCEWPVAAQEKAKQAILAYTQRKVIEARIEETLYWRVICLSRIAYPKEFKDHLAALQQQLREEKAK